MKDNNGAELVGANGAEMANGANGVVLVGANGAEMANGANGVVLVGANGFDIHQLGAVAEEVETL